MSETKHFHHHHHHKAGNKLAPRPSDRAVRERVAHSDDSLRGLQMPDYWDEQQPGAANDPGNTGDINDDLDPVSLSMRELAAAGGSDQVDTTATSETDYSGVLLAALLLCWALALTGMALVYGFDYVLLTIIEYAELLLRAVSTAVGCCARLLHSLTDALTYFRCSRRQRQCIAQRGAYCDRLCDYPAAE